MSIKDLTFPDRRRDHHPLASCPHGSSFGCDLITPSFFFRVCPCRRWRLKTDWPTLAPVSPSWPGRDKPPAPVAPIQDTSSLPLPGRGSSVATDMPCPRLSESSFYSFFSIRSMRQDVSHHHPGHQETMPTLHETFSLKRPSSSVNSVLAVSPSGCFHGQLNPAALRTGPWVGSLPSVHGTA